MRRLVRNPEVPDCLHKMERMREKARTKGSSPITWNDMSATDKAEVRARLADMQGQRCAYCESPVGAAPWHIEHFRPAKGGRAVDAKKQRVTFPELTFAWPNLFGSCDRADSCGKHKDKSGGGHQPYRPEELLNPCEDDPDRYFRFREDGRIDVVATGEGEQHRARETLRVFNLDPNGVSDSGKGLRAQRRRALASYRKMIFPDLLDVRDFSPDDQRSWTEGELQSTATEPYSAVIRHFLLHSNGTGQDGS